MVPPCRWLLIHYIETCDAKGKLVKPKNEAKEPGNKAIWQSLRTVSKNFKLSPVVKHGLLVQTNHTETHSTYINPTQTRKNYQTTYMTMAKNKFATLFFRKDPKLLKTTYKFKKG